MIIIVFLFGLVIGSFINMLVWRMHRGESLMGRSYCDKTKKELAVIDLFPVISYVLHKGRCRDCGKKLPVIYPITELLSGVLASIIFLRINAVALSMSELGYLFGMIFIVCFIMFYFAIYDLHYMEVATNSLLHSFIVVGIILVINIFYPVSFLPLLTSSILGGLAGAGLIGIVVFVTRGGGMGAGDIYLFGLAGLLVGIEGLWWTFMIAVLTGSFFGLIIIAVKKKSKGLVIPFAPLISLGTIVVLLYKTKILELIANYLYL